MDKLSLFKLIHNNWPTNTKIASWDPEKSPVCSRCVDREETLQHTFQCTSSNAHQQHKKSIKTLRQKLRKLNTAPVLLEVFTSIIESNRRGYDVTPNFSSSTKLKYEGPSQGDNQRAEITRIRWILEMIFVSSVGCSAKHLLTEQRCQLGKSNSGSESDQGTIELC